ncbi:MAG: transcriptional repressor LexA [Chloroflexi bacterium]|nr:transcriptional repressor LexA [Chloroflexota bacterium]
MQQDPSDIQQRMLVCIAQHLRDYGMPPTNRELGQEIGVQSTGHVDYHLAQLERKGFIERDAHKSRGLRLLPRALTYPEIAAIIDDTETAGELTPAFVASRSAAIPVLGVIAAGVPLEVSQQYDEVLDLNRTLDRNDIFALRVRGKSMIGDYIDDGDYIIVQRTETAANGECVVATLAGPGQESEATLKRFYREHGRIRLQPSNPDMAPIYVDPGDLRIQGRVISVIRQLN